MPQCLNHGPGRAARSYQVLGRGVTQVDDPLAEHDTPGWTVCQIDALGRNLGRQAEGIRRTGSGDLDSRTGLPG